MERISDHITYEEAVKSQVAITYGIANVPDKDSLQRMKLVASKIFEPTRKGLGDRPIFVSSFYRSPEVNRKAGGSPTSDHPKGKAIDMDGDVFQIPSNKDIFKFIYENVTFDQLIWEFGTDENPAWVHVSYDPNHNRNQVLRAYPGGTYVELIHEDITQLIG